MVWRRSWQNYQSSYRAQQIETLADWIWRGVSGSVVGLGGAGKSNLLGFLCHRPEVLDTYLPAQADPVLLVAVDLNNLPAHSLSTFYRVILRSFYESRTALTKSKNLLALQQTITDLYLANRAADDPFLCQSALHELLWHVQAQRVRVVLVMDRFDKFCQSATPEMTDTLRGLRDRFKDTLCYLVGMRQEVVYLADPTVLGELYELLDTYVVWVGPMNESDARQMIAEESAPDMPSEEETSHLLALTGRYPALLKAACHWWLTTPDKPVATKWLAALQMERSITYRLDEIWSGLTQQEQFILSEVQKWQSQGSGKTKREWAGLQKQAHLPHVLIRLAAKGLCQQGESLSASSGASWHLFSDLFTAYIANSVGRGRGKIWLDDRSGMLYQGQTLLERLAPIRDALLRFFLKHPRLRHTKTELIMNAWHEEMRQEGVTDDSLFQAIRALRQKIEPNPAKPVYIVTWRGKPEGGYQFFPEGRPG